MAKYSEYDYMFSAPKIATLASKLPDDSGLLSLASFRSVQEIIDRLTEYGISPVYTDGVFDTEKTLCGFLASSYSNLESFLPTDAPVRLMRTRYDAHNLKTAVKCRFLGLDPSPYYIDCGNVPAGDCTAAAESRDFSAFGSGLRKAALEASDSVDSTRNARNVDVIIDAACYSEMLSVCEEIGFDVPVEFLRMKIDFTNILTYIRISGIGSADKAKLFLSDSVADGGNIPADFYRSCGDREELIGEAKKVYGRKAGNLIGSSLAEGTESLCRSLDIYFHTEVREKCGGALLGALPVIGYIVDLEYFVKNLRIIISGVASDTVRDVIRERLRV